MIFSCMKKLDRKRVAESSAGGHIDVAYGIFDRPGPDIHNEELPNFKPIVPTEQVATVQLSADRPPVDDPDYRPASRRELERAAAELSKIVPDDQIEKFYLRIHDVAEELANYEASEEMTSGESVMEALTKKIRKIVAEQFRDEDLRRMKADFAAEFGSDREEEEEESPYEEPTKLADIAREIGMAGPAGVKNMLYKIEMQMRQFGEVPDAEFDAMIEFAAGEYVDLLLDSGAIDDEDADFLSSNINEVLSLPSFKFFLYKAIVAPASRQLEKMGAKGKDANFVDVALRKYGELNKSRLIQILQQAAEDPFVAEAM